MNAVRVSFQPDGELLVWLSRAFASHTLKFGAHSAACEAHADR